MEVITNKNGHRAIPMNQVDVVSIFQGFGICDNCAQPHEHGYLVPVLGSKWYCDNCYADFEKTGKFYPEDVPYEERMLQYFLKRIEFFKKIQITRKEAEDRYEADLVENGWQPAEVRDKSCSCHINAPCSKCCLDGDYFDEWCEEHNIEIIAI